MSSQRRDFRRMLYRLDLATSYPSIPSLIQHFMDETALDGVVEVKMVASPPMPAPPTTKGKRNNKPQLPPSAPLQPTTSVISFRREGRDVNAIALFGPASAPSSMLTTEERGGSHRGVELASAVHDMPRMVVKKRYPPRTTLVWVFAPLVQKLLDEGADTVVFEVRSYVAGADSVRESQALSPVSPYGTSHSTTEASPSVLASGSTPSSGGQGPAFDDVPTIQYAQSPVAYPHGDNKAPILTELHRRPQELRAEATSYEAPRPSNYSPVQGHASVPLHPSSHAAPHWTHPQPGAWTTASGYSDLQPLPPASVWESSFSPGGWNEQSDSTWQPDSASGSYGYPTIPPLPWQALQDPSYTPGVLDPATGQMYFESMTSPGFSEGFYMPNAGLGDQLEFSSDIPAATTRNEDSPMPGYAPPGTSFQGNNRAVNWQAQYPYLGALGVPPSEVFPYSPAPRNQSGGEAATSEYNQRPSTGSPASPPDSSERDSLTPTLTNPGYERASASTPRKLWPFVRGPTNQPAQRAASAYTPASHSLGVPGTTPSRSFSAMLPRPRVRLRSGSPEPARQTSIHGAKRLKVNPSIPSSSHLHPPDVASPLSAGSSSSAPRSTKSRVSSTVRSGSGAHRSHSTTSPADHAAQDQPELDSALLEILTRPAPYKRMLGYAARQQDGSVVAYELSDSVAATTGGDTLLGLGLSSVTNVAALGMELGRRAARRQQESGSRGAVEHIPTTTTNVQGEHGIPQQPRGGDARTGHIRGVSSRPGWHGCVIA